MVISPRFRIWAFAAAITFVWCCSSPLLSRDDERNSVRTCERLYAAWLKAGPPEASSPQSLELIRNAISIDRRDIVEDVLAGGPAIRRMLSLPNGAKRVELQVLRTFSEIDACLEEEMYASDWVARRITDNTLEVWTPKHGWLIDRSGHVLHEAEPQRQDGEGREWFGAFLSNGNWITTDLQPTDGKLSFFTEKGTLIRTLTCEELAPRPRGDEWKAHLIGWGRSDRDGDGWVVNVGSEEGWATVWVGSTGPAMVLQKGRRWAFCYSRALGPRGSPWSMSVPDDRDQMHLQREEEMHGSEVGYPTYSRDYSHRPTGRRMVQHIIPDGSYNFGFWPGQDSYFIGSEREGDKHEASGLKTHKRLHYENGPDTPQIDKTWLFDGNGKLSAWVRARRIGDAADHESMLFRVTGDSRIATIGPDLQVREMRRLVWKDGTTADAITLWEDLRLGLFVRRGHLVLATWPAG